VTEDAERIIAWLDERLTRIEEALGIGCGVEGEKAIPRKKPKTPISEDFYPKPQTITKLAKEFALNVHETDRFIDEAVKDFVGWTSAGDWRYANHDAAFVQSARRYFTRSVARNKVVQSGPFGSGQGLTGLAGAFERLRSD